MYPVSRMIYAMRMYVTTTTATTAAISQAVERVDAQKSQPQLYRVGGSSTERRPRSLELFSLCVIDRTALVETIEARAQLVQVVAQPAGVMGGERVGWQRDPC